MDPVLTLLSSLSTRLTEVRVSKDKEEAQLLLTWLRSHGLASLKGSLVAYLKGLQQPPLTLPSLLPITTTRPQIDNRWTVEQLATQAPPAGWLNLFQAERKTLKTISDFLVQDNKACQCHFVPDSADVFRAFELTPLKEVRVVIVGQDPYHTVRKAGPIADGLAFSVRPGVGLPPSLRNIFMEVKAEYPSFVFPQSGSLIKWAQQGVLLLNMSLTTRPGTAGAHKTLWATFMNKVLASIVAANPDCIYVLWGKEAQKLERGLPAGSRVLKAAHPSPYSADSGFFGCNHFRLINAYLKDRPIDWQL
ncbi:Uracil-DNA glycosylase [uncultured virus]|nr:Uracil-DNA glycosylase [uncultured virus]